MTLIASPARPALGGLMKRPMVVVPLHPLGWRLMRRKPSTALVEHERRFRLLLSCHRDARPTGRWLQRCSTGSALDHDYGARLAALHHFCCTKACGATPTTSCQCYVQKLLPTPHRSDRFLAPYRKATVVARVDKTRP